jgi:sensor histidine kinase YesM
MRKHTTRYWFFQLGGWSLYYLGYGFFYLTIRTRPQPFFFEQLMTHALLGLLFTHIMRAVIQRTGILGGSFKKQVIALVALSLCVSFFMGTSSIAAERLLHIQVAQSGQYSFLNIAIRYAFSYFHFIILWNLIYFTYHYIQKAKQQKIDQAKLESLLKELEIRTIKAHINPHFIFNSLNSIRALVVEEPEKARSAITQLSNILRNSMHSDKTEKTLFEKELSVAKDYLGLEQIRFENRLYVSYSIDEDTLDQPVPTMVLQALIENALKFGIDNEVKGGSIHISSFFSNSHHVLSVQSSGDFEAYCNTQSATIYKLQNRLELLYDADASFELQQVKNGVINAIVRIPV